MTPCLRFIVLAFAIGLLCSCAATDPPPVARRGGDDRAPLDVLRADSAALRTFAASGRLLLETHQSDAIQLEVALVLRSPDAQRVRAWKFGKAVFDAGAIGADAWMETDASVESSDALGLDYSQLVEAVSFLSGKFFATAREAGSSPDGLAFEAPTGEGDRPGVIRSVVDRDTLTVRSFALLDEQGVERYRLTLDDYREINGLVIARRLTGHGEEGRFTLRLDHIEVNEDLAPGAFDPPPGARKVLP
jgi:hypothetical protein